jgi:excisionase family DNA binding protein
MARDRLDDAPTAAPVGSGRRRRSAPPIPLDAVSLLAGIAPGVVLEADPVPADIAGTAEPQPATVTVEEVGRLLRCGEATVRRLIRTAVLRPVQVGDTVQVRLADVDAYRNSFAPRTASKPGE